MLILKSYRQSLYSDHLHGGTPIPSRIRGLGLRKRLSLLFYFYQIDIFLP